MGIGREHVTQAVVTPGLPAGFYNKAPMEFDRTVGWRYVREPGDVFEADGTWYLTSYEAVRFAQHHPEVFSSALGYNLGSPVPMLPLMIDPPDHARYRRVLDPMLSPKVVGAMEGTLRAQIGALIDEFAQSGECDVVRDIAELFPTQVLLTLLGLPVEDRNRFHDWVATLTSDHAVGEPSDRQQEAAFGLFGYLQAHLDKKRDNPGDDMIGRLLSRPADDAWSNEELLGMCFLFVIAALDTTTGAIGFTMHELARDPELQRQVVADPGLASPLIEEVLRLELPAPMVPRRTTEAVEVCGVTIPADSQVMIVMATANREANRDAAPDSVELSQAGRAHLSFGGGIHRCLGAHLARLELRLVVEEFHARIPAYKVRDGFEPRIAWPTATYHLESLPLVFDVSTNA
jgi:cytochrome P450